MISIGHVKEEKEEYMLLKKEKEEITFISQSH
jgi:hypothetical protein